MFSLNGFVFLEKVTMLVTYFELQKVNLHETFICQSDQFCPSDHSFTHQPSSYGWNIFIRHKTQGNQSTNHSPVHISQTVLQLPYDTPDSPRYLHVSNSTYFITLRLLVRLSSTYLCFLFSFFSNVPLCFTATKLIISVDFCLMINVALYMNVKTVVLRVRLFAVWYTSLEL